VKVVEAIIDGATFRDVGKLIGTSGGRASQHFYRACREFGLSQDLQELRANPTAVRKVLEEQLALPAYGLSDRLRQKLLATNIKSSRELTPQRVSTAVGARLLHAPGFGIRALVELQKWLDGYGLAFQTSKPQTALEIQDVEQALAVLKIYGISVDANYASTAQGCEMSAQAERD
jgi:hypothetical protein